MELKKIKELMAAMSRNKTKRLRIKEGDLEIELERECKDEQNVICEIPPQKTRKDPAPESHSEIPAALHPPIGHDHTKDKKEGEEYVTSPMVGTFYLRPNPDDPPFVKEGDKVEEDTVVCIIEAMKVMNEVKAGISGVVTKILVDDSHPVEFGTKLFIISTKS